MRVTRRLVSERQHRRVEGVRCGKKPEKLVVIDRPPVAARVVDVALSGAPHYHLGQAGAVVPCDGVITRGLLSPPAPRSRSVNA